MSNADALKKMREPFTDGQVSKLPKPTFKDAWDNLPKARCSECGGYHPTRNVIHLDYVGHAALTDRLLEADPEWSWEPLSLDDRGLPAFDKVGGLWIKLTVGGVTRLGYGDSQGKNGPNAVKEAIGDALRNAGMRFGAALDLWHKGDLHDAQEAKEPQKPAEKSEADTAREELLALLTAYGWTGPRLRQRFFDDYGVDLLVADAATVRAFGKALEDEAKDQDAAEQPTLDDTNGQDTK